MQQYVVRLEAQERQRLEQMVRVGRSAAWRIRRANVLLAVDESDEGPKLKDHEAPRVLGVSVRSIESLRKRFVEEGLEASLARKQQARPGVERMFDGEKEAKMIAIACGPKPPGRSRWTLQLLANRVVELKIVERCSITSRCFTIVCGCTRPWATKAPGLRAAVRITDESDRPFFLGKIIRRTCYIKKDDMRRRFNRVVLADCLSWFLSGWAILPCAPSIV